MEDAEDHPTDAYELGLAAAAKLKEQNEELSYQLPNALRSLFSDSEFQNAILVSGVVTNQRQTLTPISSYHMTSSTTPTSPSRMLTRSAHHSHSTNDKTTSSSLSNYLKKKRPQPANSFEIDDTDHDQASSSSKYKSTSPISKVIPLKEQEPRKNRKKRRITGQTSCDSKAQVEDTLLPSTSRGLEKYAADSFETEQSQCENENEEEGTNCLCCNETLLHQEKITDTKIIQKNISLRDILWLSLGMKKFYNRTFSTFPFCQNCAIKITKLSDICKQVGKLEDEFNEIRKSLCEGIVSKHINITNAARNTVPEQKDLLKMKVIQRMERVYKEILPGRKLLKDASQFEKCKSGNTQGTKKTNMLSNITTTHQLSEESDADDDKPPVLDCRFCDVICNTKRALSIHEKTHKNVDNQVFPCNVCDRTFTNKSTLASHRLTHEDEKHKKCQFCEKSFTSTTNLKDHIHRHLGFKQFQCTICSERYFVMRHARTHFQKRHPDKDPVKYVNKLQEPESVRTRT